jgi:hypothetical protein
VVVSIPEINFNLLLSFINILTSHIPATFISNAKYFELMV